MPPERSLAQRLVLRDDIEVVVVGERFLLSVGNDTYELPGPDGQPVARFVGLLSDGYAPDEAGALLGLTGGKVATYVADLANFGCFRADALAPAEVARKTIAADAGFVGVDATALAIARALQREECTISFADWRLWSPRDARAVPGTERFVGRPRVLVAQALARDTEGAGDSLETSPWSEAFAGWLKRRSLVVVSTGYLSPATHETVNARCGELKIPWLGIRNGDGYAEVGPSVAPPMTPCYVCLALRVLLNRSSAPSLPIRPAGSARIPLSAGEKAEMVALLVVGELRNLVERNETGPTTHLLRIDWSTNQVSKLPVMKLPNCPGCEWW